MGGVSRSPGGEFCMPGGSEPETSSIGVESPPPPQAKSIDTRQNTKTVRVACMEQLPAHGLKKTRKQGASAHCTSCRQLSWQPRYRRIEDPLDRWLCDPTFRWVSLFQYTTIFRECPRAVKGCVRKMGDSSR